METKIKKAKRYRIIGEWSVKCSLVLWAVLVIAEIVDYFLEVVPDSISYMWYLFGAMFVGGSFIANGCQRWIDYLKQMAERDFDEPSKTEVYDIYLKRSVLMVYVFGSLCSGLLIHLAFPIAEKLGLVDEFLRVNLPDAVVTISETIVLFLVLVIWGKAGERLADVTELDVFNGRQDSL